MAKILFFASLREKIDQESIFIEEELKLSEIKRRLISLYPDLKGALEECLVAVDQQYVEGDPLINKEAEVAFIPPVSGG